MGGWGRRGDSRERSRDARPRDVRDVRSSDRYGERGERYEQRGRVYSPPTERRERSSQHGRSSEARRSRSRRPDFEKTPPVREALPRRRRVPVVDQTEAAPGTTAAPKVKPLRKSKWDDRGDGGGANAVPDWVKDLEPRPVATPLPQNPSPHDGGPMVSRDSLRRKTMRLKSVQIRVLLGRGGENIKQICDRTNAEIKVDHDRISDEGDINITGDVVRAEALIRETLAQKGCPMDDELSQPVEDELLQVPGDMVGLFIGRGGEHIKAIRDACGGSLYIGVNPPPEGVGLHKIQIVGDQREKAREMVLLRLKEMWEAEAKKEAMPASRPPPQPAPRPAAVPMALTTPKAPAMAVANVANFNSWGSWDDWSDWWGDGSHGSHGMQPGMFNAMTMAMGNGMASIGRRPPAPPAPQWMGETQPVVAEAPSPWREHGGTQVAEPVAEIEEENPWAGIVPECELPS
mmetsp:Transcript_68452/g.150500  ORF Transcript_68452/g.150500 Transcript_68452/m.150500 type:complete len:460 (-) Transcript_68452:57-1436(-)